MRTSASRRALLAAVCAASTLAMASAVFRPSGTTDAAMLRASPGAAAFRDTRWYELGPKDWDPYKEVRELRKRGASVDDGDRRAAVLLQQLRAVWDDAPVNPALDGAAIRIPGYVVPIEQGRDGVTEFLLVPYFGACIHSPPPPSNQILRVAAPGGTHLRSMDSVWISGTLTAARSDSSMGRSSYALRAEVIEPYVRREP